MGVLVHFKFSSSSFSSETSDHLSELSYHISSGCGHNTGLFWISPHIYVPCDPCKIQDHSVPAVCPRQALHPPLQYGVPLLRAPYAWLQLRLGPAAALCHGRPLQLLLPTKPAAVIRYGTTSRLQNASGSSQLQPDPGHPSMPYTPPPPPHLPSRSYQLTSCIDSLLNEWPSPACDPGPAYQHPPVLFCCSVGG